MSEKFDMQKARQICQKLFDKSYSGREFVDVAYQSALAAEMLPAALDRIEELEATTKNRDAEIDRDRAIIEHLEKHAPHAYLDLQQICDDQAKRIAELEKALIEERARRICHVPTDTVGHWARYDAIIRDEAHEQLEKEGWL